MQFLPKDLRDIIDKYLEDPLRFIRRELNERWRIGSIWADVVMNEDSDGIVLSVKGQKHRALVLVFGRQYVHGFPMVHDFSQDNEYLVRLKMASMLFGKNNFIYKRKHGVSR